MKNLPEPPDFKAIVKIIEACSLENRSILVGLLRRYLHKLQGGPENAAIIHIATMYGALSETPYVQFTWGAEQAILTPDESRAHAVRIIEVASNSDADAAFIRFMKERVGIGDDPKALAQIMLDYRAMRS